MKKFLFLIMLLPLVASSQIRLSIVDPTQDLVVLKNYDTFFMDITNYRIMSNGVDTPVNKILVLGTLQMKYGEIAILKGLSLNDTVGNLTLHDTTTTNDDTSLVDFIQWGKPGQQFEKVAVEKKYWDSAAYFNGTPPFKNNCWYYSFSCWSFVKPPIIIMRFAYVSPKRGTFSIKNAGVSNIDMKFSGICFGNTCLDSLTDPRLTLVRGKYDIPKNDLVVLQVTGLQLDTLKDCITLFAVNKFSKDTTNLLDYVSWGDSLQPFSQLAHLKGIWDSTKTVHLNTAADSIVYTGDFTRLNTGHTWWQSLTPVNTSIQKPTDCGLVWYAADWILINNNEGRGMARMFAADGKVVQAVGLLPGQNHVQLLPARAGLYWLKLDFDNGRSQVIKLVRTQ